MTMITTLPGHNESFSSFPPFQCSLFSTFPPLSLSFSVPLFSLSVPLFLCSLFLFSVTLFSRYFFLKFLLHFHFISISIYALTESILPPFWSTQYVISLTFPLLAWDTTDIIRITWKIEKEKERERREKEKEREKNRKGTNLSFHTFPLLNPFSILISESKNDWALEKKSYYAKFVSRSSFERRLLKRRLWN